MAKDQTLGITVKKEDDISEWYTQAVIKGQLADFAPIQGCMIVRPNGYGIWERMQEIWNNTIKSLGVKNAYFPLFIPRSFLKKEEDHVEGFKAEVAWIEQKEGDHEKYAIRPTSETIMYATYAQWIRSHRDLPLKLNQWANIVRWEISGTRPFLRTREFLWHEGHNAFATAEESNDDALKMIFEYQKFAEESLAMPQLVGRKAESEKFPGALTTYTIEGMMPDGKALQNGTSHDLSNHFAKTFDIQYTGDDGQKHFVHQTSWGWTTRLIGGMILVHGDNKGVVIPPKVAPTQVAIVPIVTRDTKDEVLEAINDIETDLSSIRTETDVDFEKGAGFRFGTWEVQGVPLRLEIGPKDLKNNQCILVRRDTGDKIPCSLDEVKEKVTNTLNLIQKEMFETAKQRQEHLIVEAKNKEEFTQAIKEGKMALCPTCGCDECDAKIKEETAATPRVIPFDQPDLINMECIFTGKPAKYVCYYARSY